MDMTKMPPRQVTPISIQAPDGCGLAGKMAIVTGANDGIGRQTALGLARQRATVVMVCRNAQRGQAAQAAIQAESGNPDVELMLADLSSQDAIRDLAARYCQTHDRLHILVNNAGVNAKERTLTADGIELNFAVNHLAYFLLTNLLLEVLRASAPARIVNVASAGEQMGPIDFDNLMGERRYSSMAAYAQSKLANVMFTYALAQRLASAGSGVTVTCCHPGVTRTKITRDSSGLAAVLGWVGRRIGQSPDKGAETVLYLAASPEVQGVTGKNFESRREKRTSPQSYDTAVSQRLWQVSEQLTGLAVAEALPARLPA
jgi:retinol dehydrogenase 14